MEPWDSSREKAKELRLDQWPPQALTVPMRKASDRRSAVAWLKEIAPKGPFMSLSGLPAQLSGRSIGKLVSGVAVSSSFCKEAHYLAAANIDKLYSFAIEPWQFEFNPNKENEGLKARHYLYAPMVYGDKTVIVKFTVKEHKETNLENKLYSIEAMDVEARV